MLIYPSWVLMRQRQAAIPRLPSYFLKHALYVNDVEQHVFEQDKSIEEKSIYQNSMTLM